MFPVGFDFQRAALTEAHIQKVLIGHRLFQMNPKAVRKAAWRYLEELARLQREKAKKQAQSDVEDRILAFGLHVAQRSLNHEVLNWERFYAFCMRGAAYMRERHPRPLMDDEVFFLCQLRRFFATLEEEVAVRVAPSTNCSA